MGPADPGLGVSSIAVDHRALAETVVDHLVAMGHSRLGFLGSERSTAGHRELWEQVRAVCADRRLELPESRVLRVRGWHVDPNEKMQLLQLLDRPADDRPTALIAAGYHFSLDVYEAAATLGRSLPADLSVVAVGNPASAAYLAPPLTCVQQPLVELGHASVNALVEAIQHLQTVSTPRDASVPHPPARTHHPPIRRRPLKITPFYPLFFRPLRRPCPPRSRRLPHLPPLMPPACRPLDLSRSARPLHLPRRTSRLFRYCNYPG